MSDIFISYSSEDKGRVQALAHALEQKGWSVWWDRRIPVGRSYAEVIEEALDASKAVVVVWTTTSVKSQWVKNEALEGLNRRALFPVMLEAVKIPLEFRHVQAARLMDWQPEQDHAGFAQFVDDLAGVIGPPVTLPVQPTSVTPSEEPGFARAESKPESQTEPLSTTVAEVEVAPERLEQKPASEMGAAVRLDSPTDTFMSQGTTEFSEVRQEPVQVNEDRSSESTGTGQSTGSLPYLPIGIGILAVIGALVYFLLFSQGPSPVRDVAPYQPAVQPPSARTEVITPTPVPEPVMQPSTATPQEQSVVKRGAGPAKTITGKDGAPMVLIPAGEFTMGLREDDEDTLGARPAHPVYLDAYYIDQYEVTTALYARFFQQTNRRTPEFWSEQVLKLHGNKPVVGVNRDDATAYCAWAGKRLPTEAEWEKAARGTDQRLYPWGNAAPDAQRANFNRGFDFKDYGVLADVGSYEQGKSPYGVYDMAGNVLEWVADWFDDGYYGKSPRRNPKGPSSGEEGVLRGGSWMRKSAMIRSMTRFYGSPMTRNEVGGIRCAQDVPK